MITYGKINDNIKFNNTMTESTPKSFMFIGDLLDIQINEPIKILPNCILKKANDSQIELINKELGKYQLSGRHPSKYYTHNLVKDIEGGYTYKALSKENWKYYVIEYEIKTPPSTGPLNRLEINLDKALALSSLNLNVLYHISYEFRDHGFIGSHSIISSFRIINKIDDIRSSLPPVLKSISNEDIQDIQNIYNLIENFDSGNFKEIDKALSDFLALFVIMAGSFKVVAIFSVLEFLLVNPKNNLDSITHQLKKKIPLLNNRFDEKLDFSAYFQGPDTLTEEKIIEKLYKYRSSIAHGSLVDFQNDLQILDNPNKVYDFLYTLLRMVIIQAVKEPRLFTDLKNI